MQIFSINVGVAVAACKHHTEPDVDLSEKGYFRTLPWRHSKQIWRTAGGSVAREPAKDDTFIVYEKLFRKNK